MTTAITTSQPFTDTEELAQQTVDNLLDIVTVDRMLEMLSNACDERARLSQDTTAREWRRAARAIYAASIQPAVLAAGSGR